MTETWKPIPGYGSMYEVSDAGRVRRWWRGTRNRFVRLDAPEIIAPQLSRSGSTIYVGVNLGGPNGKCFERIHSLVLLAFVGERPAGHEAAHYDGDGRNNRLENLRWATCRDNNLDKRRHGRNRAGERSRWARLTAENVAQIRQLLSQGKTQAEVAAMFGVTPAGISAIAIGRTWAA